MVVAVGVTLRVPLAGTVPRLGLIVTVAAPVEDHDNVADWPAVIDVGDTDNVTVGRGTGAGAATVSVTCVVAVSPAELVATAV